MLPCHISSLLRSDLYLSSPKKRLLSHHPRQTRPCFLSSPARKKDRAPKRVEAEATAGLQTQKSVYFFSITYTSYFEYAVRDSLTYYCPPGVRRDSITQQAVIQHRILLFDLGLYRLRLSKHAISSSICHTKTSKTLLKRHNLKSAPSPLSLASFRCCRAFDLRTTLRLLYFKSNEPQFTVYQSAKTALLTRCGLFHRAPYMGHTFSLDYSCGRTSSLAS